jgi:hypothetical protein
MISDTDWSTPTPIPFFDARVGAQIFILKAAGAPQHLTLDSNIVIAKERQRLWQSEP